MKLVRPNAAGRIQAAALILAAGLLLIASIWQLAESQSRSTHRRATALDVSMGGWQPARLNPRTSASMVWDTSRGRLVLFGGFSPGIGILGETWEWDGNQWQRVSTGGPHRRYGQSMVFDPDKEKTILFGGTRGDRFPLNDTWEWDGASWILRDVTGPPPRWGHSMVYDTERKRIVLFGGCTLNDSTWQLLNDTWEFDGTRWSLVSTEGPQPRQFAAMGYDPLRRRTVLFSGNLATHVIHCEADTWEWDGTHWERIQSSGSPGPRERSGMVFDMARGHMALFGGRFTGCPGSDLWSWDGATWTRLNLGGGPRGRQDHAMAYDPVRNQVLVYGGQWFDEILGTMYGWDGATWERIHDDDIRGMSGLRMAYHAARNEMFRIGGGKMEGEILYSSYASYRWTGTDWKALLPRGGSEVPMRGFMDHGMTYDSSRDRFVLFGGGGYPYSPSGPNIYNDTWEWIGPDWQRVIGPGPPGRQFLGMAYDKAREHTLLFGGHDGWNPLDDTWKYDATGWTCISPGGAETMYGTIASAYQDDLGQIIPFIAPESRYGHAMTYDEARERIVLFGGRDLQRYFDDTWEWDGRNWEEKDVQGPSARIDYAMTYDPERERVVLNGGTDGASRFADTWEYDGLDWSQVLTADPAARSGHALAYNPAGHDLLLYGGRGADGQYLMDTWRFTWPDPVSVDLQASDPAWAFGSSTQFSPPDATLGFGVLPGVTLRADNNLDTFGYWESLEFALCNKLSPEELYDPLPGKGGRPVQRLTGPTNPGAVYLAGYVLRSQVADPARVPQFRMRWNQSDLQQSTVLAVESRDDGLLSPDAGGGVFVLPFSPPWGDNRFTLSLDLLNFDPRDEPGGDIQMDYLEMTALADSRLSSRTIVREYTFDTGAEGWNPRSAPPFDPPVLQWKDGALTSSAIPGSTNTFGYWESPPGDLQIDPALLYILTFEVESDARTEERAKVPQFRVRVNEGGLHTATFLAVESQGDADRSPTFGAPQLYLVYFQPIPAMAGQSLLLSFDFLNFDPVDDGTMVLGLNSVKVEAVSSAW